MSFRALAVAMPLALLLASCGGDDPTGVRDTVPPARITDLTVTGRPTGCILRWTAPGDDENLGAVTRYDIRRIQGDITAHWNEALPVPGPASIYMAGGTQTVVIDTLEFGTWQFAVKAADEVPNWSELSNIASLTLVAPPVDTIPPAPVTDLAAEALVAGVRLRWTAPGDDGQTGTAAGYDLRYSLGAMTPDSWPAATHVDGVGEPKAGGTPDSALVAGLQIGKDYSFALKSVDDKGNWSGLSNIATVRIPLNLPKQLTFNLTDCGARGADWSRDGSSIACGYGVLGGFSCVSQIFVVPLNGGDPEQYTSTSYQAANPAWSPDGTRFVLSAKDDDPSPYRIVIMEATPGAAMIPLASHPGLRALGARWSPDGTRIAYSVTGGTPPTGLVTNLYVVPSDGGTPTWLAGPFRNTRLSWGPDGATIAFDSDASGSSDIWLMPSAGGEATRLTTAPSDEYSPSWSPDGTVIAYVAGSQIWGIAPTGGSSLLLINDTGVRTGTLAWSPDGQRMAYTKGIGTGPSNIWVAGVNAHQ